MKIKNKLIAVGLAFSSGIIATTSLTIGLSSCGTTKETSSIVISTNNEFLKNEEQYYDSVNNLPIYQVTSEPSRVGGVQQQASILNLYENAKLAKQKLEELKQNDSNLNENEKIWLDSYITQWDIKILNLEKGTIYLGMDPISGGRILSSRSNNLRTNIDNALLIYQLNEETGDPDESKLDNELVKSINERIDNVIQYISNLKGFLTDGMTIGVMPSNIVKKSFIKQTIETYYSTDVANILNDIQATNSVSMQQLFDSNPKSYFNDFLTKYQQAAKQINFKNADIQTKINQLSDTLNDFMSFYTIDYWQSTNSFGYVGYKANSSSVTPLQLTKDNNLANEVEETLVVGQNDQGVDQLVYGLGYTKEEIELNNIGIGFMNPITTATNLAGDKYNGNDIYNQLLYNNNSVKDSANEIYTKGIQLTTDGINKMKEIAQQVITDIFKSDVNTWNPEISYTADPYNVAVALKSLNDISNNAYYFAKFNIWLNQEDFFFGRETLNKEELLTKYWTNSTSDDTINNYKNIITTQGYTSNWDNNNPINGSNVTVEGKYALAGAVSSLESYLAFKNSTNEVFSSNFYPIADYVLSPYNYSIRKDIGVGMEGPRGSKQFQYNCDPYYSLQKWSVASLTTHEGAMGHHTQQEYWTEYMPGTENGKVLDQNLTPGYTFVNDAFHEGWAVFTEWFAAELGIYGTWDGDSFDGNVLPTNWTTNTSTILNIQDINNVSDSEIDFIKNYQGGVYWNIINNITNPTDTSTALYKTDKEKAIVATKLANMLAYYGFLNEAQLRNMRMALDTAVNYKYGLGNNDLNYGASIQNERDYMKNNSGLGDGDVKSESIRYTAIPSQATGYMLGKVIINDLYTQVKNKYISINQESNNKYNFVVNQKDIIKDFFDLTLKNGEIPLSVLQQIIKNKFQLN
ncbi:MAG: DUF885 domain-containing protein [Ureaplasma sp.]|nr:DUF885 domain-containing protein [Ureaplasma sp.]MDE7221905.1 DUF885 domain-containing protein [Ureaplasma sp.]